MCPSSHLQSSGRLRLHSLAFHSPRRAQGLGRGLCLQGQGLVLDLRQRVHHGHVHVEVVGLFKPPATLVTGEVQLSLCLVFGHVVLEGCSLPALEPTDLTPEGQRWVRKTALGPSHKKRTQPTLTAVAWLPSGASGGQEGASAA
jgi:hypothetical protein